MPHPSCDRLTHRPPSPPHLHWRAANPPRVPPTQPGRSAGSRDSSRGRGKGATSFQCFVAAHSQHRAPRMKDEGSSSCSPRCREGRGHWCQQRGLLWEGDMGLIEPQVCPMHSQPAPSPQKSKVSGASSLLLSAGSWTEGSTLISSYLKVVLSLTEGTGRLAGFFSESLSRGEPAPCPGRSSPRPVRGLPGGGTGGGCPAPLGGGLAPPALGFRVGGSLLLPFLPPKAAPQGAGALGRSLANPFVRLH